MLISIPGYGPAERDDVERWVSKLSERSRSGALDDDGEAHLANCRRALSVARVAARVTPGSRSAAGVPGVDESAGYGQPDPPARADGPHWEREPADRLNAMMARNPDVIVRSARDLLEADVRRDAIPARSAELLEAGLTKGPEPDRLGLARYLSVTGSETYRQAFTRALLDPHGPGWMAPEPERAAMREALAARRALELGGPSGWQPGSYPVPFQLDPTVTLTSDGVRNPLRQLCRVEQILGKSWLGVTSQGVTVTRADELEEAGDNSPDLAQPEVGTSRVQAFVPFSVEVEQDWSGLMAEIAAMLADAKDTEEANSFVTGAGTGHDPQGIITALAGSDSEITTAATATFTLDDIYATLAAVPPRFRSQAAFTASLPVIQAATRMEVVSTVSAVQGTAPNQTLVGQPLRELSTMDDTVASGNEVLLCGDFKQMILVERLGMSVELVPHLFGPTNGYPTGSRGIFALWRTGSRVLVPNAFRLLKVG